MKVGEPSELLGCPMKLRGWPRSGQMTIQGSVPQVSVPGPLALMQLGVHSAALRMVGSSIHDRSEHPTSPRREVCSATCIACKTDCLFALIEWSSVMGLVCIPFEFY